MTIEREDYRRTEADKLYAETLDTAVTAAPTDDEDGFEINDAAKKGPRYLSYGARLAGTTAAACRVWFWFYHDVLEVWCQCASVLISTDAAIAADTTDLLGNVGQILKPSWATRGYITMTDNLSDGVNELSLVIERDT